MARELAAKYKMTFVEVSAKSGESVEKAMTNFSLEIARE